MKVISWSGMVKAGAPKVKALCPIMVTVDGEPAFIVCQEEDVILISDLHIRVRNMLRAMEKRARVGMPADVMITAETV